MLAGLKDFIDGIEVCEDASACRLQRSILGADEAAHEECEQLQSGVDAKKGYGSGPEDGGSRRDEEARAHARSQGD